MAQIKQIQDLMVDIFDFPHLPYWFTIRQAIGIIKASRAGGKKFPEPLTILVFDEKYCLLGTMGLRDILRGIEPGVLKNAVMTPVPGEDESKLAAPWAGLFGKESRDLAERPVKEVMNPAIVSVGPEDPAIKAAFLMLHHNLSILPVQEDSKKLVGLVRMTELFDVLSIGALEG